MTQYKVDTVFLSHIHSYFSFIKGNVHYVISGGAGAELLTQDSYYHYLRVKIVNNNENYIEMVQLPSPTNTLQDRYLAGAILFANSIYKEYQTTIISIAALLAILAIYILYSTFATWWRLLKFIGTWLLEVIKFAIQRYREKKQ